MVFIKTNRKLLCLQQSKSQTSEGYEFQTLLRGCSANFMMYQRIHQNALSSKLLTNMTHGKKKNNNQPCIRCIYIYISPVLKWVHFPFAMSVFQGRQFSTFCKSRTAAKASDKRASETRKPLGGINFARRRYPSSSNCLGNYPNILVHLADLGMKGELSN